MDIEEYRKRGESEIISAKKCYTTLAAKYHKLNPAKRIENSRKCIIVKKF